MYNFSLAVVVCNSQGRDPIRYICYPNLYNTAKRCARRGYWTQPQWQPATLSCPLHHSSNLAPSTSQCGSNYPAGSLLHPRSLAQGFAQQHHGRSSSHHGHPRSRLGFLPTDISDRSLRASGWGYSPTTLCIGCLRCDSPPWTMVFRRDATLVLAHPGRTGLCLTHADTRQLCSDTQPRRTFF